MNYWIFQAVPDRYDLREQFPDDDGTEKTATWYATRYRSLMEPGDLVFFWLGGGEDIRGIYGWGYLTSNAYIKKDWDSYGVDVRYSHRLPEHLSVVKTRKCDALKDMLIHRAAMGTNFLLSEEEKNAIVSLLPPKDRPR